MQETEFIIRLSCVILSVLAQVKIMSSLNARAANDLLFINILKFLKNRNGIKRITIIDARSPEDE